MLISYEGQVLKDVSSKLSQLKGPIPYDDMYITRNDILEAVGNKFLE
jgi:hypothetical protein